MALTLAQKAKRNYNFGKLTDGVLEYAPYYLVIGTRCYVNPKADKYLSEGWKQIVYSELPENTNEELQYVESYSEDETKIYAGWILVEEPT